jgi:hypothetical protein
LSKSTPALDRASRIMDNTTLLHSQTPMSSQSYLKGQKHSKLKNFNSASKMKESLGFQVTDTIISALAVFPRDEHEKVIIEDLLFVMMVDSHLI